MPAGERGIFDPRPRPWEELSIATYGPVDEFGDAEIATLMRRMGWSWKYSRVADGDRPAAGAARSPWRCRLG